MGKFEGQISLSNPEENFCLKACVLFRHESIEVIPDPLLKLSFAKGLAKGKLEGAC